MSGAPASSARGRLSLRGRTSVPWLCVSSSTGIPRGYSSFLMNAPAASASAGSGSSTSASDATPGLSASRLARKELVKEPKSLERISVMPSFAFGGREDGVPAISAAAAGARGRRRS